MWWAERKAVEEREGDERCGERSRGAVCEGDGGDEAELGAGVTGYDGGRGLEEGRWSQGTVGMLRDLRALTCCGLWV
ncbi:unnamed protein product [Brassica rapa]|uniref:Uncharacterized protein n=1 Tax=Brassica campestris TaxID=3711 RepID=A0A3P5Y104_BRACM|nr:unnamed protein product [Brassica rapa]VDC61052.1 unnamed protein product [Brassica rapa]